MPHPSAPLCTGVKWIVVNILVLHHLPVSAMPEKLPLNQLWMPSRSCGQKGRTPGRLWHPRTQHTDKPGHAALRATRKLLHCSTDPVPFAIPSPNYRSMGRRGCSCVTQSICFFLRVNKTNRCLSPASAFARVLSLTSV